MTNYYCSMVRDLENLPKLKENDFNNTRLDAIFIYNLYYNLQQATEKGIKILILTQLKYMLPLYNKSFYKQNEIDKYKTYKKQEMEHYMNENIKTDSKLGKAYKSLLTVDAIKVKDSLKLSNSEKNILQEGNTLRKSLHSHVLGKIINDMRGIVCDKHEALEALNIFNTESMNMFLQVLCDFYLEYRYTEIPETYLLSNKFDKKSFIGVKGFVKNIKEVYGKELLIASTKK